MLSVAILWLAVLTLPAVAAYQPDDDAATDAPADEPAPDEAADEAEPGTPKPPKPDTEGGDEATATPTNPAVLTILESNPTTPYEQLRAIKILVDLDHAKYARPLVDALVKQPLDLAAKAALAARFNTATLMHLATNPDLRTTLGPFVDELFKASQAYRRDPKRLAEWARQLSNPDETIRARAARALLETREAAVAPLVNILADKKQAKQHAVARAMLVRLGDSAVAPLLGVLESPDAALRLQAVEVLGRLHAVSAVPYLLAPLISTTETPEMHAAAARALEQIDGHAPQSATALRLLEYAVRRSLEQSRQGEAAPTDAEVWHWDAGKRQSIATHYSSAGAELAKATRLARELAALDSQQTTYRRLYLTALLQQAKLAGGLDKSLPTGAGTAYAIAAQAGTDVLDDLLAHALTDGYIPAATGAAQILGDIGTVNLINRGGVAPSPLASAANHADHRLRFTATNAILKLDPRDHFAGASYVTEGLAYFIDSVGTPRVLVVHPRSDQAQQIAGMLIGLGYEADIATNGRDAYYQAIASPDYQFILIHTATDHIRVDDLVMQLRKDRRTALVPIGLMTRYDNLPRIRNYSLRVPRSTVMLQPETPEQIKIHADTLTGMGGSWELSNEERMAQAGAALDWLILLGQRRPQVFDLLLVEDAVLRALYTPELTTRAIVVLGQLGTAKAQQALIELANLGTQSREMRDAAVEALARAFAERGIMLTSGELTRQYELYNSNAGRDPDNHAVLGSILDAVEHKGNVPHEG